MNLLGSNLKFLVRQIAIYLSGAIVLMENWQ